MVPEFLHETVNIWHCQFNIFSERLHISLQDLMFCNSQVLNQFILVHLLWGIRLSMRIKTAVDSKISCEIQVTTNQTTRCHDQDNHNMTTSLVTVSLDKYSYISRGLTLAIYQESRNQHNHSSYIKMLHVATLKGHHQARVCERLVVDIWTLHFSTVICYNAITVLHLPNTSLD
jgi:hypothetical protein